MKLIEKLINEQITNEQIRELKKTEIIHEINKNLNEITNIIKKQKFIRTKPYPNYKQLIFSTNKKLKYGKNKRFTISINAYDAEKNKFVSIMLIDEKIKYKKKSL